jgi:hypothetical protein
MRKFLVVAVSLDTLGITLLHIPFRNLPGTIQNHSLDPLTLALYPPMKNGKGRAEGGTGRAGMVLPWKGTSVRCMGCVSMEISPSSWMNH